MIKPFNPDFSLSNLNLYIVSGSSTSAVLPNSDYILLTVYGDGPVKIEFNNIMTSDFSNSILFPSGTRDVIKISNNNVHIYAMESCYVNIVGGYV